MTKVSDKAGSVPDFFLKPRARALLCGVAGGLFLLVAAGSAPAEDPFLRRTATVRAVEKVGPAVVSIAT